MTSSQEQMHEPAANMTTSFVTYRLILNSTRTSSYRPTVEYAAPVGSERRQCLCVQDAAALHAIDSGAHTR